VCSTSIRQINLDSSFFRENFLDVERYLKSLGATHVITYDDLEDRSTSTRVKEWTGGKVRVHVVPRFHLFDIVVGYPTAIELCRRKAHNSDAPLCWQECPPRHLRRDGQGAGHLPPLDFHIQ